MPTAPAAGQRTVPSTVEKVADVIEQNFGRARHYSLRIAAALNDAALLAGDGEGCGDPGDHVPADQSARDDHQHADDEYQVRPAPESAQVDAVDGPNSWGAREERRIAALPPRPRDTPADDQRDERLREARADAAYLQRRPGGALAMGLGTRGGPHIVALDEEITRLDGVMTAVRKICAEHWQYQVRREAKFGRKGSPCLCEICQVVRTLDEAEKVRAT